MKETIGRIRKKVEDFTSNPKRLSTIFWWVLATVILIGLVYNLVPQNRVYTLTIGYTGTGSNDTVFYKEIKFNVNKYLKFYYIRKTDRTGFPIEWNTDSYWIDEQKN
jgi:cytochrome c oxidase assembly protein Cox11